MIDAYEIGITLALENGVSEGLAVIRRDLQALDQAIAVTTRGLAELARMAQVSLPAAPPGVGQVRPERPVAVAAQGAAEPVQAIRPAAPAREDGAREVSFPVPAAEPAVAVMTPRAVQRESEAIAVPAAPREAADPVPVRAVAGRREGGAIAVPAAPREAADAVPVRAVAVRIPVEPAEPRVIGPVETVVPAAVQARRDAATLAPPVSAGPRAAGIADGAAGTPERPRPVRSEVSRPASPRRDEMALPMVRAVAERKEDAPARVVLPQAAAVGRVAPKSRAVGLPAAEPPRRDAPAAPRAEVRWAATAEPQGAAAPGARAPMRRSAGRELERPAAPPPQVAANGPIGGDVYLDGAKVGRWMSEELGRAAARPPSGPTGFDPRVSPGWGPLGAG